MWAPACVVEACARSFVCNESRPFVHETICAIEENSPAAAPAEKAAAVQQGGALDPGWGRDLIDLILCTTW